MQSLLKGNSSVLTNYKQFIYPFAYMEAAILEKPALLTIREQDKTRKLPPT